MQKSTSSPRKKRQIKKLEAVHEGGYLEMRKERKEARSMIYVMNWRRANATNRSLSAVEGHAKREWEGRDDVERRRRKILYKKEKAKRGTSYQSFAVKVIAGGCWVWGERLNQKKRRRQQKPEESCLIRSMTSHQWNSASCSVLVPSRVPCTVYRDWIH